MHRDKTLNNLLVVLPLFLVRVVVTIGVDLRWQVLQLYGHASTLNHFNCDLLVSG